MEEKNPKEELVIDQILNQNYNPRMFIRYLSYKKQGGDNIEIWSLKELKKQILEYKKMIDGDEQQMSHAQLMEQQIFMNSELKLPNNATQEQRQTRITKVFKLRENDTNGDAIYTMKMQNQLEFNYLFDKEISVGIQEIKKESHFFFFKKVYFQIETRELGWQAFRTFDDFLLLRNSLAATYPFIIIPEVDIIRLKQMGYLWENDFIKSQKKYLNYFLKAILSNAYLKNSSQIIHFLHDDREKFLKNIQNINQQKKIYMKKLANCQKYFFSHKDSNYFRDIIKEIPSFQEETCINVKKQDIKFALNAQQFVEQFYYQENRFVSMAKTLIETYNNLGKQLNTLKNQLYEMYQQIKSLESYSFPFQESLQSPYTLLNDNLQVFEESIENQRNFFISQLFENMDYMNNQSKQLLDCIKEINRFKSVASSIKSKTQDQKKIEDLEFFDVYLNSKILFNFKSHFLYKNREICKSLNFQIELLKDNHERTTESLEDLGHDLKMSITKYPTDLDQIGQILVHSQKHVPNFPNIQLILKINQIINEKEERH